ncbi:MAG: GH1 family beta-glucosidase [Gemmatimonadota bacterium]|nr:GH1 family beta-glucosidase [Gemmatimonadota bacterium]
MSRDYRFPDRFLWGAATSAYQIEGYPLADGAGPSIWERFAHTPGNVVNDDTGDIATDHYHRFRDDVKLMRELGLTSYRFSIAWSRILPEGTGRVNDAGIAFYDKLIDALLEANIAPMVTLYHWDLPEALDARGGWLNRDVAHWFSEYAHHCFRAFDDRVPKWVTLNEPWVVMDGGYVSNVLAPGHRNFREAPIVTHNLLRAHGAAVRDYRACGGQHEIGLVVNLEPKYPATDSPEDLAATSRADAYMNRQYLDPVFLGSYPEELLEIYGDSMPVIEPDDWPLIQTPFDFLGINYYSRNVVRAVPDLPLRAARVRQEGPVHTEMDWEVFPEALTRVLVWIKDRYGNRPMYITENGAAFDDPPHVTEGIVDDPLRVWYFRDHLRAAHDAIAAGVDLRGYFAWSLLDNFEWSYGYGKRFGIVHVDFDTLERTPKSSARFYSEVIRTHGAILADG